MTPIAWRAGGEADATSFDGRTLVVRSTRAFAIGQRIDGELRAPHVSLRAKVLHVVRDGERFELTLAPLSMSRETRGALEKALLAASREA